jgi:hypothetical protein
MKQHIRELLEGRAAGNGGGGEGQRTGYGYGHGDTYHRYTERCRIAGIAPKQFAEWLAYELAMSKRRGSHVALDDYQRQFSNA